MLCLDSSEPPATDIDMAKLMTEGAFNCLALHKEGLFAGGLDGIVRRIDLGGSELRVIGSYSLGRTITSLSFNTAFTQLAIGSDLVSHVEVIVELV